MSNIVTNYYEKGNKLHSFLCSFEWKAYFRLYSEEMIKSNVSRTKSGSYIYIYI